MRQRHLSKDSLLLTDEETGKSPNTLVLQRSSCGSVVLVTWLSPLSPGAQKKEIAQDGFIALLSCVNPVPAIYPAEAHGSSFLSETSVGIWWTGMWLRVGEIPFTSWNPQQSQQGCKEEGREGRERKGEHIVIVQLLIYVQLFVTPRIASRQVSLSFTISQSLLKLMSIESGMPSSHLVLYHPLILLPSIFPRIGWLRYWNFSFSISPSNAY